MSPFLPFSSTGSSVQQLDFELGGVTFLDPSQFALWTVFSHYASVRHFLHGPVFTL